MNKNIRQCARCGKYIDISKGGIHTCTPKKVKIFGVEYSMENTIKNINKFTKGKRIGK